MTYLALEASSAQALGASSVLFMAWHRARQVREQRADSAYAERRRALDGEISRGTFLRAEVLRQWQDFVGAGQVARVLAHGIGGALAFIRGVISPGPPAPATEVREPAFADLTALTVQHADGAARRTASAWSSDPFGSVALQADASLWGASPVCRSTRASWDGTLPSASRRTQ